MTILTATEIRDRAPFLEPGVTDTRIERAVAEFTEVAEGYRGCRFGTNSDPDDDTEFWVPIGEVLRSACAEYVSAVVTARQSGTSRDIVAQTIDGSWTRYSTPDMSAGRPTGWTEVDRLLNSLADYRIPGFA